MKGFSDRNLKFMRKFAEARGDLQFVQQVAAQIPLFFKEHFFWQKDDD
jgi:hypothetical protein